MPKVSVIVVKRWFRKLSLKHKILLFSLAGVILLLILYILLGLQFHFVFNEEMNLQLSPTERSFNATVGSDVPVNFTFSAKTPFLCSSYCSYNLTDLSSGDTLDNGSVRDPDDWRRQYQLSPTESGEGQTLYQFKVTCHSKRTDWCRSSEKKYRETALLTINRKLSPEASSLKQVIKRSLQQGLDRVHEANSILAKAKYHLSFIKNRTYASLPGSLEELENAVSTLEIYRNALVEQVDDILGRWEKREYEAVDDKDMACLKRRTDRVSDYILESEARMNEILRAWNRYSDILHDIKTVEDRFITIQDFYLRTLNTSAYSKGQTVRDAVLGNLSGVENGDLSLSAAHTNTKMLHSRLKNITDNVTASIDAFKTALSDDNHAAEQLMDVYNTTLASSVLSNASNMLVCDRFLEINKTFRIHNDNAGHTLNVSYPHLVGVSETDAICHEFQRHMMQTPSSSFSPDAAFQSVTIPGFGVFNYSTLSDSDLASLCPINRSRIYDASRISYCTANHSYNQKLLPDNRLEPYEELDANPPVTVDSELPYGVPSNLQLCCFRGSCDVCCDVSDNCSSNLPVVFVHGHALSKSNSPELSLTAFSQMQERLEDEGYINAGKISDDSRLHGLPEMEWGRIDAPVSVRVSYYYVTHFDVGGSGVMTRKTDRIENYALRLKEFIDIIKHRTGSDEVIIISHSMGGLVAREHLRLFGPDDVKVLVTIGTPNHGIEGSIDRYCAVTGAEKECEDMAEGSYFLKRLNDAQEDGIPGTDVHTIRGVGCEMADDRRGDGVVLAENVPLDFATNHVVNGSCSSGFFDDTLHSKLVEPASYPKVYNLVLDILDNAQD